MHDPVPYKVAQSTNGSISTADFCEDNPTIVSASENNGSVTFCTFQKQIAQRTIKICSSPITSMAMCREFSKTIVGTLKGEYYIIDSIDEVSKPVIKHTQRISAIKLHPDNEMFATASDDGSIKLFDLETCQQIAAFYGHNGNITDIAFGANGYFLISLCTDKIIRFWNLETFGYKPIRKFRIKETIPTSVLCNPDGHTIYIGMLSGDIVQLSLKDGHIQFQKNLHSASITCMSMHPCYSLILTSSLDSKICLVNASNGDLIYQINAHQSPVTAVHWTDNGEKFMSTDKDGHIIIWNFPKIDQNIMESQNISYLKEFSAYESEEKHSVYGYSDEEDLNHEIDMEIKQSLLNYSDDMMLEEEEEEEEILESNPNKISKQTAIDDQDDAFPHDSDANSHNNESQNDAENLQNEND